MRTRIEDIATIKITSSRSNKGWANTHKDEWYGLTHQLINPSELENIIVHQIFMTQSSNTLKEASPKLINKICLQKIKYTNKKVNRYSLMRKKSRTEKPWQ